MGRLRVQLCVVTNVTRQYGPHPTSDLLGVDYFRTVPADTEFPKSLARIELFVRFFGIDLKPTSVRVVVVRRGASGFGGGIVYRKRFDMPFSQPGPVVIDRAFKLLDVQLTGEGDYAVRVLRKVRSGWESNRRWRVLASDYFSVERAP